MTNRERLDEIREIIIRVDHRAAAVDGPVSPTLQEMTQKEISEIYKLAGGFRGGKAVDLPDDARIEARRIALECTKPYTFITLAGDWAADPKSSARGVSAPIDALSFTLLWVAREIIGIDVK